MIKLCNLLFVVGQDDHWPRWPSFVICNFQDDRTLQHLQPQVVNRQWHLRRNALHSRHHLQLQVFIYFFFDKIFNFRMTFVNERGEVVEAGKDIALHYVKGKIELELHISGNPYNPKVGSCRTWSPPFRSTCSTRPAPSTTWWATTTTWRATEALVCPLSAPGSLREGKLNNAFEKDKGQRVCDWRRQELLVRSF